MKVLVTGAAGFIGSHVLRQLVTYGVDAAGLIRPGSRRWRLEDPPGSVAVLEVDLDDVAAVRRALEGWRPDACVHLAWYAVPGRYLDARENVDSLISSLKFIEQLLEVGCSGLVISGTCLEYDLDGVKEPLREDSPVAPATIYASAKHALHGVAAVRCAQAGCRLAWARLFYLFGPYEDDRRLVPSLIQSVLEAREFSATSGEQLRDYLHVEDVADALCRLAVGKANGTFNVASGNPVRISDLIRMVTDICKRSDLVRFGALSGRPGEPAYVAGDAGRLRAETGWAPRLSLSEGLGATVDWWRTRTASVK
jgi:nucleoside-diphosphate-sugar epimerase